MSKKSERKHVRRREVSHILNGLHLGDVVRYKTGFGALYKIEEFGSRTAWIRIQNASNLLYAAPLHRLELAT